MFSYGHIFFIIISIIIICISVFLCNKYKVGFDKMLNICLVFGVISETIKLFALTTIVPIVEPAIENGELVYKSTNLYTPYLRTVHLPLELCSLNILFMLVLKYTKNIKVKQIMVSILYASCIIGGFFGIVLSSIVAHTDTMSLILSIRSWQFFIYHSMLIVFGIYLYKNDTYKIKYENLKYVFTLLFILEIGMLYINSIFIIPVFKNPDTVIGARNINNFLSTYNNPFHIIMDTKLKWIAYLLLKYTIEILLINILFLPFKERHTSK